MIDSCLDLPPVFMIYPHPLLQANLQHGVFPLVSRACSILIFMFRFGKYVTHGYSADVLEPANWSSRWPELWQSTERLRIAYAANLHHMCIMRVLCSRSLYAPGLSYIAYQLLCSAWLKIMWKKRARTRPYLHIHSMGLRLELRLFVEAWEILGDYAISLVPPIIQSRCWLS